MQGDAGEREMMLRERLEEREAELNTLREKAQEAAEATEVLGQEVTKNAKMEVEAMQRERDEAVSEAERKADAALKEFEVARSKTIESQEWEEKFHELEAANRESIESKYDSIIES